MEEQFSEDESHKPQLPCVTSQLEIGSPSKDLSHDEKQVESESPDSPSAIKRWEIGPLLQSFKSKMASFTEIVMSPVRLFKPSDTLSSIAHPDQHKSLIIESNDDASTQALDGSENDSEKCRNGSFSKRRSSEKLQSGTAAKRHKVVQRLNFSTISTNNNHKPLVDQIEVHNEDAPSEEDQIDCPLRQSQAVLQNETCVTSPCKAQHFRPILSTGKTVNEGVVNVPSRTTAHMDSIVVLHRLSGERQNHSSDKVCDHSSESYISEEVSDQLNTHHNCSTKPDHGASLMDKGTGVLFGSKQSYSRISTRKSHRKKPLSWSYEPTATEMDAFETGSKTLDEEVMDSPLESVVEVSDHPKCPSVGKMRTKRSRETPHTKKDLEKCDVQDFKEGRPVRAKKVKQNVIVLEANQKDETFVQVRKKRKGFSIIHPDHTETSEETRQDKTTIRRLKKVNCETILRPNSEGDDADPTSAQKVTQNISNQKSLSMSTINVMNGSSEPPGFQHPTEQQKPEKTTRQTRWQLKGSGDALQKRKIRPPKHMLEDYIMTSVVDPAGRCKPSKRKPLHTEQSVIVTEEHETCLSREEVRDDASTQDSAATVQLERNPIRSTKNVNRRRRKGLLVAKRKGATGCKDEVESQENMTDIVPVVSLSGSGSNRLLRSYSCPEIPSLVYTDCRLPRSHTHDHSSTSPNRKSSSTQPPIHFHSPSKRTRRHTVCSVEIEREIAPLCLRKEVYPACRSGPLHPSFPYSPSTSLTILASCFLSSPLAFLSKSSSQVRHHVSDASTGGVSPASIYVASSSPSTFSSPFTSSLTSCHASPGPSYVVTPSPETPSASVSSLCSAFSQSSLEGNNGLLQMECEETTDEEERSSFDFKLSAAISEEKALSDSEIKNDMKDGRRGKVSSIRICKKIPKPQNNLTPMGLPKVIRIKKKDFSLEEIYTNKNFSKPPDGRLETIFEVPLSRRDGSQAVVGPKKVKRFVEFPEVGVARKPRKPLVGVVAGGGAQRKAGSNSGVCRPRRGVGGSSKAEQGLTLQELEALLCSKLEELDAWMALQQVSG